MKITIYELLGLVKDGKAPKTIKSEGHYYNYNELEKDYYEGMGYEYEYLLANTSVKGLYDKIEIIEDIVKEKEIPEKLKLYAPYPECEDTRFEDIEDKINEIIDYLKSKGE